MKYYRQGTIVISEDDSSSPKDLRFQDAQRETIESTELANTALTSCVSQTVTIPAQPGGGPVTYELFPPADMTTGKYFYLRSDDNPISLQINNGAAHVMSALHVNELWTDFTSLKVTNHDTAKPVRLTWVIAGL